MGLRKSRYRTTWKKEGDKMKAATIEEVYKRSFVIERLRKKGYTSVDGKSYRELKKILALLEIKAESPHNSWF